MRLDPGATMRSLTSMEPVREKFAVEMETFERLRPDWVSTGGMEGWWVAIRGDKVCGPIVSFDGAWRSGVDSLGVPGSFLVKQVERDERPILISHLRRSSAAPKA